MAQTTLKVAGMSCEHCKTTVSKALTAVSGVSKVDVDLATKDVSVTHEARVDSAALARAVEAAGYSVG